MLRCETSLTSLLKRSVSFAVLGLAMPLLMMDAAGAQNKKPAPAKAAAPASHASSAAKPANTGGRPGSANTGGRPGSSGTNSSHTASTPGTTRTANGGSRTVTKSGAQVTKSPTGKVTEFKSANGHEAKFNSQGHVKEVHGEVHGNKVTVSHGPAGMRRTVVERPDHSRLVADGHGRGYIQRPYEYGGHAYYSRAYYYNGGYYNSYYRGYYYNGVYLNGYMPAYYYPAAYYGWAYNPWPAPVPYAWGWGGNPWYGYYGAYFAPYPVYPSAAFWIADYLVAASLRDAYAAAAIANAGRMEAPMQKPRLIFASYDPATDTTSPTMTKEVKDAVSQEISSELAAQKAAEQAGGQSEDKTPANLETLMADGKPHVFVASSALSVTSAGTDCGLTEGDVLALNATPPKDATATDLRVLASKQSDCAKGSVVTVEVADLQEMHNHLLSNIDKGMQEMKDHPGQGGLPAPPADAIAGTKAASYTAAAPAADPNGGAELDAQAQEGTQLEQQVVAEANTSDGGETAATAGSTSPIGATQPAAPAAPARPAGPVTIALGQTPAQVIASKGQPTNKVNFPNKVVYIYPDMKIIFVGGKVSDVQ